MMRYCLLITILFLSGCASTDDACSGVSCESWQSCDAGVCELKDGFCDNNGDCSGNDVCYTETHLCGERDLCEGKTCSEWSYCALGECIPKSGRCDTIDDCSGDQICNDTHTCADRCDGVSCDDSWQSCDPKTGSCVAKEGFCDAQIGCNDPMVCNQITHLCQESDPCEGVTCENWEGCDGGLCKPLEGRCNSKDDCDTGFACDEGHTCADLCKDVVCENWQQCNTDSGVCETADGFCETNGDCLGALVCSPVRHLCEENGPCLTVLCEGWQSCNPADGSCMLADGRCETEVDCSGDYEVCDDQHTCVVEAIEITETPDTFEGSVTPEAGDLYKIELKKGERINFKAIFLDSKGDIELYLYLNTLDDYLYFTYSSTDNETLEWIALEDGTYYLEVITDADNDYTLIVDSKNSCTGATADTDCPPGSYCGTGGICMVRLDCIEESDCDGVTDVDGNELFCDVTYKTPKCDPYIPVSCGSDDYENNDYVAVATEIQPQSSYSGVLCSGDDDWFTLNLEQPGSLDITLTGLEDKAGIYLYNSLFEKVEYINSYVVKDRLLYLRHIPADRYYIKLVHTGTDPTPYGLNLTLFTPGSCTQDSDCYESEPLKSSCNDEGYCESNSGMVLAGEVCESNSNCPDGYRCYNYKPGASGVESTCRPECEDSTACNSDHFEWCYLVPPYATGLCAEDCYSAGGDQYCQDLMKSDTAVCSFETGACSY